jgi:uncharacterized protein
VIIDAHTHLEEEELPVAGLLGAMDRAGVDKAVLIPATNDVVGPIVKAGTAVFHACMVLPPLRMRTYAMALRRLKPRPHPDNTGVFEAAAAHPDRLLPFACVNPRFTNEAHEDLDRYLPRARGVKLHLWLHRYRLPEALPILKRIVDADLPVLAHLGFGPPEDVEIVMEKLPRLKLILAHAGIPHFERLWKVPGIFFDTGSVGGLISLSAVREMITQVGEDRVIFGSDAPTALRVGGRAGGQYAYDAPPLPERSLGQTMASLL